MKKLKLNKDKIFYTLLTVALLGVTLVCLITGSFVNHGYNLSVDMPSDRLIKATEKVENTVATERLRVEAEAGVTNLYKRNEAVEDSVIKKIDNYFDEIDILRKENTPIFDPSSSQETSANSTDGGEDDEYVAKKETPSDDQDENSVPVVTLGENVVSQGELTAQSPGRGTSSSTHTEKMKRLINENHLIENFSVDKILYVVNLDTPAYNTLRENIYEVVQKTFNARVMEENLAKSIVDMKNEYDKIYSSEESGLAEAAYEISAVFMLPNFVYDEEATSKLKEERRNEVQPVYYLQGQTIVNNGDIISEEAYAALESLGLIAGGFKENIVPILGVSGIALFVFLCSYLYISYNCDRLLKNRKEALLVAFIYTLVICAVRLFDSTQVWLFMPVLAFTMLVAVLIDIRLAIVLNFGVSVITAMVLNLGKGYIIYFLLAGVLIALISKYAFQRNNLFFISLVTAALSAVLYAVVAMTIDQRITTDTFLWSIYAFLNGILTVMLVIGSLPLWEAIFGIVTQIKLLDLINPDSPLLRRLTTEAPGTYHHSLIVANLAETAAYDIGADPNIARVAGYYHDIGKLKYPQYFSENQVGENLHDELDPYSSVAVITSHVNVGLQMAEEYRIPKIIRDIIEQHHGSTLIKYFYHKAATENPEDSIDEGDFRYKLPTPQSREAAIVMLADTVEAAVRSMFSQSKSMNEIENFTRLLIKDKLDDNQLIDSGLTIKDIETVGSSFMRVFKGMYHERIPYPKMEKKEKN